MPHGLSPAEMRVADLIRNGRTTKEIANLLNTSVNTILFHRFNLRRKLGIKGEKANLRTYLHTFD
jgi:DNA-binding CsgD family transcriptional regulator